MAIVVADDMWEKLQHSGKGGGALVDLVEDLRRRREELRTQLKAKAEAKEHQEEPRPSAIAMGESEKFKGSAPAPTPEQSEEAEKNLDEVAKQRSEVWQSRALCR